MSDKQMVKRNQRIKKLYKSGKYSVRGLARKVGLSKSRVGEIILA